MKNKVKYPVALAIRYIFHKFLLYNQHNERHLKLYIEIIGDIWHSFWDNQKGQNAGGGKKGWEGYYPKINQNIQNCVR